MCGGGAMGVASSPFTSSQMGYYYLLGWCLAPRAAVVRADVLGIFIVWGRVFVVPSLSCIVGYLFFWWPTTCDVCGGGGGAPNTSLEIISD